MSAIEDRVEISWAEPTASANPTPSAIGLSPAAIAIDQDGQVTCRVPLDVPPGIAALQPKLELTYAHRRENGVMGVGWSLTGTSAISRVKATYAVDGFRGAISYDENDRLAVDGQRLICVEGAPWQPGALYFTEIQSWRHVRAGASSDAGFVVTMKNGQTMEYGTTPDSRIAAAGGDGVREWALSATSDRNGNRIEYSYTQTPVAGGPGAEIGAYYLDQIRYTVRDGAAANRTVDFSYELRDDSIVSYVGGFPVIAAVRLKEIVVSLATQPSFRTYSIDYRTSIATGLSCVSGITQSTADGAQFPMVEMEWQDVTDPSFAIGPPSILDQHLGDAELKSIDVNGDGRTDLVQLWIDENNALHATTYLATPGPDGPTFERASDSLLGSFPATREVLPMDLDGDGRTDLVVAFASGPEKSLQFAAFLSNGTGFDEAGTFATEDSWTPKHINFFAMDANGDGRTDIVEAFAHNDPSSGDLLYFRSYLSTFGDAAGNGFTPAIESPTEDPAAPARVLAFWPMDVNGDGMMDLVRIQQRGSDLHVIATAYLSVCTSIDNVSFARTVETDLGAFSLQDQLSFQPVDVNGDGIQDLLQIWQEQQSSGTLLHLTTFLCNAAGGFVPGPDSTFADQTIDPKGLFPMSFNGAGQTALVSKWISSGQELMFTVFPGSPSGTFRMLPSFSAGTITNTAQFTPGDPDGNGKADLIRTSTDEDNQVNAVAYLSSGAYPDLVTSITNPLGGVAQFQYAPLSDPSVYDPGAVRTNALRYATPLTPAQSPAQSVIGQAMYVATSYSLSADPAANRFAYTDNHRFRYSGGRIDLRGRGWQGFATVEDLDVLTGRVTSQTHNQDFPFTGSLAEQQLIADGQFASDPRVPRGQRVLMRASSTQYQTFPRAAGVVEVLPVSAREERYDYGAGNFDFATGRTFAYDDFGNETLNTWLGYIDRNTGQPLDSGEVVYRHSSYLNDVSSDAWALGFRLCAKVTANAVDADITRFLPGDFRLEQQTWTETFDLAARAQWDDVNSVFLTTSYTYDAFGNRLTETAPGGFVTTYDYEPVYNTFRMRETSPADANGVSLVTLHGYDPRFGAEAARRDPAGNVFITVLDGFGRKVARQGPVPDMPSATSDPNRLTPLVTGSPDITQLFLGATVITLETTDYLNDGSGGQYRNVQSLQSFPVDATRELLSGRSYSDGRGRERQTVRASGQSAGDIVAFTDYDGSERVVSQSLPFFATAPAAPAAVTTYDVLERPIVRNDPAGADGNAPTTTTWQYGTGGLVTTTSGAGSDAAYVQIDEHHFFDAHDKVRSSVIASDNNTTTTFRYDALARLVAAIDPPTASNPAGITTTMTYDSLDRQITADDPDRNTTGNPNVVAVHTQYDPVTGDPQRKTDASGAFTEYAYDAIGRVTLETDSTGRTTVHSYDAGGRLSRTVLQSGGDLEAQYDFAYDQYENVITRTVTIGGEPSPFMLTFTFDPQKRVVQQTLPDGAVTTSAYSFGRLVRQSINGVETDTPLEQYHPTGVAGRMTCGGGVLAIDYTFNPAGLLYGEVVTNAGGQVLSDRYRYDALNQILAIDGTSAQAFTYANRRLMSASIPGFAPASFAYDASGNMTVKDGVSFTFQAHFAVSGNGASVFSATADACGRTSSRTIDGNTMQFAYDARGSLRLVTDTNGALIREILTDGRGLRLRQRDGEGNVTLYISPSFQGQRTKAGVLTTTQYLRDARGPVAAITASGTSYLRRDHKGNVTHTFDTTGTLVGVVAYSAYGQPLAVQGPGEGFIRYEQRRWESALGLYDFGARHYDPFTGCFLTPDDRIGGRSPLQAGVWNRYAFELNNPINIVDRTGHGSDWIGGLIIGLVAVAIGVAIIATGGAAAPLAASMFAGAFIGGGVAGVAYSASHKNDFNWGDYGKGVGISAGIGFLAGGAFYGAGAYAGTFSTVGRQFLANAIGAAVISSASDVLTQLASNAANHDDLAKGLGESAGIGFAFGFAAGMLGVGASAAIEKQAGRTVEAQTPLLAQQATGDLNPNVRITDVTDPVYAAEHFRYVQGLQTARRSQLVNSKWARGVLQIVSAVPAFPESYLEATS